MVEDFRKEIKDFGGAEGKNPRKGKHTHLNTQPNSSFEDLRRKFKNQDEKSSFDKMEIKTFTEADKEDLDRNFKKLTSSEQFKNRKDNQQKLSTQNNLKNLELCPVLQHESQEKRTRTQIRSFTKWVNKQLERGNFPPISAVTENFSDGKSLLNLIAVLFPQEIRRNHGELTPFKIRDNIAHAIKIIESCNIDLVNIDADEIINKNVKLTLGLTWSLILRSIANFTDNTDSNFRTVLLNWCRECTKRYDNVNVTDFSTSWKNGLAFNAILHHFNPSFNYESLSPANDHYNLKHAFDLAEKTYKIAPLLDVTDLTDNILPDEKSIITYLSDYYLKLECLDFKSHLEKGKQYMSNANRKISEGIASYDKLYHQIYTCLQEKAYLQNKIADLIEKHQKIDKDANLDENIMKISSLYGDLQTAFPIFRSKDFITENLPIKLLKKHINSLITYKTVRYSDHSTQNMDSYNNQIKSQLDDLKQHMNILSTRVCYGDGQPGASTGETFQNCLRILEEKTLSGPIADLYSEKIRFLTNLAQHKKYANYRLNTAIRLFRAYDTKRKGTISTSDMKNCCAVLDIPIPKDMTNIVDVVERESEDCEITFDYSAYLDHVKAEFLKQEKKSLTVADESAKIHSYVQ